MIISREHPSVSLAVSVTVEVLVGHEFLEPFSKKSFFITSFFIRSSAQKSSSFAVQGKSFGLKALLDSEQANLSKCGLGLGLVISMFDRWISPGQRQAFRRFGFQCQIFSSSLLST
jgi:hypothetical protein